MPDEAQVCSCNDVTKGEIVRGRRRGTAAPTSPASRSARRPAPPAAAACRCVKKLVEEHFAARRQGRRQGPVRALRAHPAGAVRHRRGARHHDASTTSSRRTAPGRGCDICKPAVASILASQFNGHVLDERARRRCRTPTTHFLANIQRNGTYSVVPRIPGGEITPEKLIVIGEVARDFGLYTKITGGQRIDLFGARMEQLPAIWRRLVDAGLRVRPRLRQGAADGEVLRRLDLVPLRRAGLRRAWRSSSSCATAGCARRTSSRAASAAAPASAPRPAARTSA